MNKPVAWGVEIDGGVCDVAWDELELADIKKTYDQEKWDFKVIPLYTHPVKDNYRETHEGFSTVIEAIKSHPVKELTDKEILTIAYEILEVWNTKEALIEFARAILRKASEK